MHKLKEMLMKELKEYESKVTQMSGGKLSAGDLQTIHMMTDTIKNIDKIEMLEGGEGYSEDGMSYDGGNWQARGSYDGGSSYARGRGRNARRDSMGRYSREGGYSSEGGYSGEGGSSYRGGSSYGGGSSYAGGGNRGGYSRDGAKDHMIRKMEEMLDMAESEEQRKAIEHCIRKLEEA